MIQVRIATHEWNPQLHEFELVPRAEIQVDGRRVEIRGDADYIGLDIPVVEPETGRRVLFHDDPEVWAKSLPFAYRTGDITAEIVGETGLSAHRRAEAVPA